MTTTFHHASTAADQAAMATLRAIIAENTTPIDRASFDQLVEQTPPAEGVTYSETAIEGVPGVWCSPAGHTDRAAMIYLHGGAYVLGSARAYRHFAGHVAARAGLPAFVVDYRLAPEHPFPAAVDDARAVYRALAARFGSERIAIVGDSAGGGLSLALLQEVKLAACGVLFSPWTDLALTGSSLTSRAAEDPALTRATLEEAARQYVGREDPRDPRASPLYGRRTDLPPIQVHVGTAEVLLDDSLRLRGTSQMQVHVWNDMPHVFPRMLHLGAAREALALVGAFVREQVGQPTG